jgi:hypothetical protein
MTPEGPERTGHQGELFETDAARSLLDQLLSEARLYTQSKDYKDLLDFVARMRNFAPFNAMLLQVQKPGLRFAACALRLPHTTGRCVLSGSRRKVHARCSYYGRSAP